MSLPVLRGTLTPLRQRSNRHWHPEHGYVYGEEYRTFSDINAQRLFNAFAAIGVEVDWSRAHGNNVLTTTDTRGEQRIDRWEMQIDEEQPSVLEDPWLKADVNGGPVSDYALFVIGVALSKGLTLAEATRDTDVTTKYPSPPVSGSGSTDRAFRIYEQMKNGQTQYQKNTLILVHTTNVSGRYQLNIADTNVNRLYTHSQFLSECLNTNLWVFPLPGAVEYALTYFHNDQEPAEKTSYLWSWLKSGSPRATCANNRVDIVTKYKLDFWSTDRYALATT